jgi:hypothetical protein
MIHKLNFYFIKELDKYHINKLPKNIFLVMLFPRQAEALQARQ